MADGPLPRPVPAGVHPLSPVAFRRADTLASSRYGSDRGVRIGSCRTYRLAGRGGTGMRVGIIGGGAAGLASAWLLEHEHEVTLFEKDDRFGGHAHTVTIEADGQQPRRRRRVRVLRAGRGLCDVQPAARHPRGAAAVVSRDADGLRRGAPAPRRDASAAGRPAGVELVHPAALGTLIRFRRFLADVPAFLAQHDRTLTIGEYLERQRLPREFVDGFLLPAAARVLVRRAVRFQRFTAYNALYYLGANMPTGLRAPDQSEIEGGLKVYVDALVGSLERATLRRDSAVARAHPRSGRLDRRRGRRRRAPHLRPGGHRDQRAPGAAAPRSSAPRRPSSARSCGRLEYFDTTIAIHGDRRLMPRSESAWSVVNARWDGCHSSLSIWNPERGLPVFKSWVTFDQRAARAAVRRRALRARQGRRGLLRRPAPAQGAARRRTACGSPGCTRTTPTRTRARSAPPCNCRAATRARIRAPGPCSRRRFRACGAPGRYGVAPGRGRRTSR